MVRKDEPLKVTDLEAGEDASSSKEPPKSKSVFNRLAYGGYKKNPQKVAVAVDEQQHEREIIKKTTETAGKTGSRLTGKSSSIGKNALIKNNSSNKLSNNVEVQQQQQQLAGTASAGSSVFDRLTSGERLYRTTQSGRKPAGRRAGTDQTVDLSSSNSAGAGKETSRTIITSSSKVNNSKSVLPTSSSANDAGADEQAGNNVILTPEREEMNGFNENDDEEEEGEDPVIQISLIQQPQAKVRSSPRPVLKKSARLLLSQREQLRRRKSWRLRRIPLALVERTSLARGALPILPQGLAWICLIFNAFLPGTGTILSGLFGICLGAPRFSAHVTVEHRFLAFIINLTVGIFQAFTVLFCLVGWCWSLGWGIILVKTSGHYNRWKISNLDHSNEDALPHMMGNNNADPRY